MSQNIKYLVRRNQLWEITLSEEKVAGWVGNLDTSKASGPDGLPARLLKECNQQIAPSICCLFNLSLKTIHIHKKDSKNRKLPKLKHCAYFRFYKHIVSLVCQPTPAQHSSKSIVCQSTSLIKSCTLLVKTQTKIYRQTFCISTLRRLLTCYPPQKDSLLRGDRFYSGNWFANYLTQRVAVGGMSSKWLPVVSQRSNLPFWDPCYLRFSLMTDQVSSKTKSILPFMPMTIIIIESLFLEDYSI